MTKCSVKLLDPQLDDNVLGFLNSSAKNFLAEKIFTGRNFSWAGVGLWKSLPRGNFYIVHLHVLVCETYTHVFITHTFMHFISADFTYSWLWYKHTKSCHWNTVCISALPCIRCSQASSPCAHASSFHYLQYRTLRVWESRFGNEANVQWNSCIVDTIGTNSLILWSVPNLGASSIIQ